MAKFKEKCKHVFVQNKIILKTDNAIILRLTKLTETSLIVTFLTHNHGLVKAVAKGARGNKSKFKGKIDLFYSVNISWIESRKSELHQLSEVTPSDFREPLRLNYDNMEMAAYFTSLLEAILQPEHIEEEFYTLLERGLNYLCKSPATRKALEHFEKESAKLLGIFSNDFEVRSALESTIGKLPNIRDRCIKQIENK